MHIFRAISRPFMAVLMLVAAAAAASAHPHVFIEVRSQLIVKDGALVGFRHTWVFDDVWLQNQLLEHDTDNDGKLTPAELEPLAVESRQTLEMFRSFTVVRAGGALVRAVNPRDVSVDYHGAVLALSFTASLARSVPLSGDIQLEVYDQTFFSGFTFAGTDAIGFMGTAPLGCTINADASASPQQMNVWRMVRKQLGPEFNDKAGPPKSVVVSCPKGGTARTNEPMAVHQPVVDR